MASSKKIYIVGPTESVLTKRGNRHPSLAAFLVREGYDLEYVTSDFYHAEKRWFSKTEIEEGRQKATYKLTVKHCIGYMSNVSVRRVISNSFLSLSFFLYLLPRLNRQTVLILPSRPVEMMLAAAVLRIVRGTSVLLDIRDVWPDGLVLRDRTRRFAFNTYCHVYLYPSLRFLDKFVHVAPSFVDWLHRYAPRKDSVFVPLGYDRDRWESIAQRRTGPKEPIDLVCVAMLQHLIDVMPVLQAINGDERFRLTLIGDDGQGERYAEVVDYIEKNHMENVTIVGRLSPDEVVRYLNRMDIGVVPMISSSIPNKVFDYIAARLPLLVLGENDCADLVEEMGIGWSCSYDESGVRAQLADVDTSAIRAAREHVAAVRDRFGRDHLFRSVVDVIESGVSRGLPANFLADSSELTAFAAQQSPERRVA